MTQSPRLPPTHAAEPQPSASTALASAAVSRLARLEGFLLQEPGNPALLADAFDAALAASALDKAETLAARGTELDPASSDWRFRLANLRIAQTRYFEAQAILQGLSDEGIHHSALTHNLAYIALYEKRYADCRQIIEQEWATAKSGQSPPIDPATSTLLQIMWLRVMHRLGKIDDAMAWVDGILGSGPLPSGVAGVASLLAIDGNRLELALRLADQALANEPLHIEALVARASVALAHRDPQLARRLLSKSLEHYAIDGRAWSALGFAYLLELDVENADRSFKQAVHYMPGHIGTWHGLAWCSLLRNDVPEAKKAFESALAIDHNMGETHGGLAIVLALSGQEDEARKEIEIARRLDKDNLSSHYASAVLNGDAHDAQRLSRLAERVLSRHAGPLGKTMLEWTQTK